MFFPRLCRPMCGSGSALPGTALFLRGSAPIAPGSMRKRLPGATLWLVSPNSLGQSPIKIPQLPEGPQPLPHIGRHSRKEQSLKICVDANETSSWHLEFTDQLPEVQTFRSGGPSSVMHSAESGAALIHEPPLLSAVGSNSPAVFRRISDTQSKSRVGNASFRSRRSFRIMPRKKWAFP